MEINLLREQAMTHEFLRSLWVVWLMAIFVGIAGWAFWPRRRGQLEAHGRLPLEIEERQP